MTIIIDGMDQAKFSVPRNNRQNKTKDEESLIRPPMHVVGTWIHGAGLHVTIAEPDLAKDSNQNQECIARALNAYFARASRLPLNLHIRSDNTCREGKNQFMCMFAAALVGRCVFKTVALEFLTKGRTLLST